MNVVFGFPEQAIPEAASDEGFNHATRIDVRFRLDMAPLAPHTLDPDRLAAVILETAHQYPAVTVTVSQM